MTTPPTHDDPEFDGSMRRLETLLSEVESIPDPRARAQTGRVVQGVMEFHGAAVARMLECLVAAGSAGRALIDNMAVDDLVGSLLLLYGLHPQDLLGRVGAALEKVRPYLASHGGSVELLEITNGAVVRLRMQGSCHGCPSSAATLKSTIEAAIYEKAPDVTAIEVDGVQAETDAPRPPAGFVPVEQLIRSSARARLPEGATL